MKKKKKKKKEQRKKKKVKVNCIPPGCVITTVKVHVTSLAPIVDVAVTVVGPNWKL